MKWTSVLMGLLKTGSESWNMFEGIEVEQHLLTEVTKKQKPLFGDLLYSKRLDPFDLLRLRRILSWCDVGAE